MSPPVWFITGCSSGFGASLILLALHSGHKVIATSRSLSKTPELVSQVEELGGTWMQLDVCAPEPKLIKVIDEATSVYGKIDILVNNAGYALLGAFETISDKEGRAQMDTNFFGPMSIIRHVVPTMRERRSGVIVNFSSTAGIEAKPSRSLYSGSKFALEAMSEALYSEMKPLGIRVLIVEPGGFRTKFASQCVVPEKSLPEEYKGSFCEQVLNLVKSPPPGFQLPGDVEKGCQAIFDVVMKTGQAEGMGEFLRLPLGKDGSARWEIKLADLKGTLDATEKIWASTDCDD